MKDLFTLIGKGQKYIDIFYLNKQTILVMNYYLSILPNQIKLSNNESGNEVEVQVQTLTKTETKTQQEISVEKFDENKSPPNYLELDWGLGEEYFTYYTPIYLAGTHHVVGILYVGLKKEEFNKYSLKI
mgnify:CR=1 FL=1